MSSHSSSIDSSSEVRDSLTPPLPSDTTTPSTAGASTPIGSTPFEAGNTGSIESKSSVAESGAAIRRGLLQAGLAEMKTRQKYSKKRSICYICEHFESSFNDVSALQSELATRPEEEVQERVIAQQPLVDPFIQVAQMLHIFRYCHYPQ